MNWKSLKNRIPHFVQMGKSTYEVLYIDEFKDGKTLGETRFDPKQIVIKNGLTPKMTVITFLHECFHSASEEFGIGLTENQVLSLEKSLYFWLKPGNIFKAKTSSPRKKARKKKRG